MFVSIFENSMVQAYSITVCSTRNKEEDAASPTNIEEAGGISRHPYWSVVSNKNIY